MCLEESKQLFYDTTVPEIKFEKIDIRSWVQETNGKILVMHTRRHLIQVKIHDQSDPGAFSYKIDMSFFFFFTFQKILNFFIGPHNLLCTSFHAKTTILYSGQNS